MHKVDERKDKEFACFVALVCLDQTSVQALSDSFVYLTEHASIMIHLQCIAKQTSYRQLFPGKFPLSFFFLPRSGLDQQQKASGSKGYVHFSVSFQWGSTQAPAESKLSRNTVLYKDCSLQGLVQCTQSTDMCDTPATINTSQSILLKLNHIYSHSSANLSKQAFFRRHLRIC